MKAEFWAVLTALCWGIGSLFEKKGVKIGGLTPITGVTIRTFFTLLILSVASYPYWGEFKTAGLKSIGLIAVGGGVFAGSLGIIFLYTGLKTGSLSTVMTVAFCFAPVVGALLGFFVLNERLSALQVLGICLCIIGAAMATYFKST